VLGLSKKFASSTLGSFKEKKGSGRGKGSAVGKTPMVKRVKIFFPKKTESGGLGNHLPKKEETNAVRGGCTRKREKSM